MLISEASAKPSTPAFLPNCNMPSITLANGTVLKLEKSLSQHRKGILLSWQARFVATGSNVNANVGDVCFVRLTSPQPSSRFGSASPLHRIRYLHQCFEKDQSEE